MQSGLGRQSSLLRTLAYLGIVPCHCIDDRDSYSFCLTCIILTSSCTLYWPEASLEWTKVHFWPGIVAFLRLERT